VIGSLISLLRHYNEIFKRRANQVQCLTLSGVLFAKRGQQQCDMGWNKVDPHKKINMTWNVKKMIILVERERESGPRKREGGQEGTNTQRFFFPTTRCGTINTL
jgi:hypothetical protein